MVRNKPVIESDFRRSELTDQSSEQLFFFQLQKLVIWSLVEYDTATRQHVTDVNRQLYSK
jgi:hypothetical protein